MITADEQRQVEGWLGTEGVGIIEGAGLRLAFENWKEAAAAEVEAEAALKRWIRIFDKGNVMAGEPWQLAGETWGQAWARHMNEFQAKNRDWD